MSVLRVACIVDLTAFDLVSNIWKQHKRIEFTNSLEIMVVLGSRKVRSNYKARICVISSIGSAVASLKISTTDKVMFSYMRHQLVSDKIAENLHR